MGKVTGAAGPCDRVARAGGADVNVEATEGGTGAETEAGGEATSS